MVNPCGKPRLIYNIGRIYSYQMMVDMFSPLKVREFSLWNDWTSKMRPQEFIRNADPTLVEQNIHGCGMWLFEKEGYEAQ